MFISVAGFFFRGRGGSDLGVKFFERFCLGVNQGKFGFLKDGPLGLKFWGDRGEVNLAINTEVSDSFYFILFLGGSNFTPGSPLSPLKSV